MADSNLIIYLHMSVLMLVDGRYIDLRNRATSSWTCAIESSEGKGYLRAERLRSFRPVAEVLAAASEMLICLWIPFLLAHTTVYPVYGQRSEEVG